MLLLTLLNIIVLAVGCWYIWKLLFSNIGKILSTIIIIILFPILFILSEIIILPAIEIKLTTFALNSYDSVLDALEKYHTDNDRYPNTLNDLIPRYLNKIPDPQETLGYDLLDYAPNATDSMYIYFINGKPGFMVEFFKSYGAIGGEKFIYYCPVRFQCKRNVNLEKISVSRIDDQWIYEGR